MHAVAVNGLCASPLMGRVRAFAAAADAVAARPDAVVAVVRYADPSAIEPETVAVVSYGTPAPLSGNAAAPADAAPADLAAPVDLAAAYAADHDAVWRASDAATADVVAFGFVAETVNAALADITAASLRAASTRQTSPHAYETACRVRFSITQRAHARIVDAVADAADGFEPDAVAVVVVPADRPDAFAVFRRAGVACIRRAGAVWDATDGERAPLLFGNVADALAYATGHAAKRCTPH